MWERGWRVWGVMRKVCGDTVGVCCIGSEFSMGKRSTTQQHILPRVGRGRDLIVGRRRLAWKLGKEDYRPKGQRSQPAVAGWANCTAAVAGWGELWGYVGLER